MPFPKYQEVGDSAVDRTKHVWRKRKHRDGGWKCVLCGGVSWDPDDESMCRTFEPLLDEERLLCQPVAYGEKV